MITLRLAALVAALVTITLNAHNGFKSTTIFEYAVLFAVLFAALDIAKCSCLVGMRLAWQGSQPFATLLLFLLFWPLLINSLWCGLSEVTISRAKGADLSQAQNDARARTRADQERVSRELAAMEANQTFSQSAGCALPKGRDARTFCTTYKTTKSALSAANRQLTSITPTNPYPQLTLLAELTGYDMASIAFSAALWPVLLAELLGSVGFYLSGRINDKGPQKPIERVSLWRAILSHYRFKTPFQTLSGPSGEMSKKRPASHPAQPPQSALHWKIPKP